VLPTEVVGLVATLPLNVAANAWLLFGGNSFPGERGIESGAQVSTGDGAVVARAAVVFGTVESHEVWRIGLGWVLPNAPVRPQGFFPFSNQLVEDGGREPHAPTKHNRQVGRHR